MEEGIDGLVYISDLSWTKKVKHPSEVLTLGEKIDVIVLELDVEGRKLSLGHKHTKDNPWDKYENDFAVNTCMKLNLMKLLIKEQQFILMTILLLLFPYVIWKKRMEVN